MINELEKYKNKDTIVLLPSFDFKYYDSVNHTLGNVIIVNEETEDNKIIEIINKSKIKKIYLFADHDI